MDQIADQENLLEKDKSADKPADKLADKLAEVKLVDVVIADENIALNVLVSFLNLGQRRGVFSMDESAKIWECIKVFQKKQ